MIDGRCRMAMTCYLSFVAGDAGAARQRASGLSSTSGANRNLRGFTG